MYPAFHSNIPPRSLPVAVHSSLADEPAQKNWFGVYTFPQHEKSCVRHLEQRGLHAFLPTYVQEKQWKNRQRVKVQLPLFPSYLFVQMSNRERSRVLGVPGILRVLGNSQGPQPIPSSVIDLLRADGFRDRLQPQPEVVVGQKVRIRSGAMQGIEGVLMRKKNCLWFVLLVDLINQRAMVEVNAEDIESLPE
jgi:transcription antitermination factor NusG